ncbi:hypothetical protein ACH5RR_022280 [Cinchona calisaya]|uniref:Phytosulfokine n=1 Tax=Cinchona calisaya TaxID=153742 RepID=A0ABD2Z8E1_9GENT
MSKISTLCIISLLLFLTLSYSVIARPVATFHDITPMETHHDLNVNNNNVEKVDKEESCEGLGEDECMMRRTLQAQLDYIYTQKQKQP